MKATEAVDRIEKTGAGLWPEQAEILADFYQKECLTKIEVRNGEGDPSKSLLKDVMEETSDTWGRKTTDLMKWPERVKQLFFEYQEIKVGKNYLSLPEELKEKAAKIKEELEKRAKAAME